MSAQPADFGVVVDALADLGRALSEFDGIPPRVSVAILDELPPGRRPSGRHLFRDDGYEVDVPYYLSTASEIDAGAEEVYLAPVTEWNVVRVTDGLVSAIAREILDKLARERLP